MNPIRSNAMQILGVFCLAVSTMPTLASAQAQGRGGRGGAQGMGTAQIQEVLDQLDLTDQEKTKVEGIVKEAQQNVRDTLQGLQDATPEERRTKMQDAAKMMTDARDKIGDQLTSDQKAKYYPLLAKAALKRATDLLTAIKSSAGKMDLKDDNKKQLTTILEDSQKTLDGYKDDAETVKDPASSTDFTQKMTKFQMDLRKQIVDLLGPDDGQKLMQDARQAMGTGGRGGNARANRKPPATEPAGK